MKVMDGWFLNWIGDLLHKLPDQSHQFEWHEWYAWRPVRVHHYHHTGQFPIGETVGWAWLEPVWRRRKLVNMATELKTYYVIKRYQ